MATKKEILIHLAQSEDIPILVTHYRQMFREICRLQNIKKNTATIKEMENNYAEKLKVEIKDEICKAWLLKSKDKILASGAITFISLAPNPFDTSCKVAYLHSMYTEKKHRNKGYAERIIKEAIEFCKKEGINRMLLNTSHAGKPLYEKIGFELSENTMRLWVNKK